MPGLTGENDVFMKIFAAYLFCLLGVVTGCVKPAKDKLISVGKDGLFGYVSMSDGDTVLPCIYPIVYTDTIENIGFVRDENGNISCINTEGKKLFNVFEYDNGPDYPQEGLFRIVDDNGLIGFADTLGRVVIPPKYKFAFPFSGQRAKVTNEGYNVLEGEHSVWKSSSWFYIENPLAGE